LNITKHSRIDLNPAEAPRACVGFRFISPGKSWVDLLHTLSQIIDFMKYTFIIYSLFLRRNLMLDAILANIAAIWIVCSIISLVFVFVHNNDARTPEFAKIGFFTIAIAAVLGPVSIGIILAAINSGAQK
jgi:hypothetical protein